MKILKCTNLSSIRDQKQYKIAARDSFPYITQSTTLFGEANSTCLLKRFRSLSKPNLHFHPRKKKKETKSGPSLQVTAESKRHILIKNKRMKPTHQVGD